VGVPGVRGEQRAEPTQQPLEPLTARARERLPGGRERLLEREPQELVDQGVLAGEPPVHGAHAHPGPGGDLLHAGVRARLAKDDTGGLKDPVVVAGRVAPLARRWRRVPGLVVGHRSLLYSPTVSPVTASPAVASVPAGACATTAASPATLRGRRAEGISSPASAATTRTPAMIPNPVV